KRNGHGEERRGHRRQEKTKKAHHPCRDRRDGGGPADDRVHPAEEEAPERAKPAAEIRILAARFRNGGAQFPIGQGAKNREQRANDPGGENDANIPPFASHFCRFQKDARPDHGASYNRRGSPWAESSDKFQALFAHTPPLYRRKTECNVSLFAAASGRRTLFWKNTADECPHRKCHTRANQPIPGERNFGVAVNRKHDRQSGEHSCQRTARVCAPIEGAQEKESKQAAQWKGGDREPGLEQVRPFYEPEDNQHGAPDERHAPGDFQKLRGIGGPAAQNSEIHHTGSSEGVQRTAGIRHRHRENGSKQQARESCGHFTDQEERQDAINAVAGGQQRNMLRKYKEKEADQEEHGELKEHDKAA